MNIFTRLVNFFKSPIKSYTPKVEEEEIHGMANSCGIRWNTWDNLIGTKEDIIKYIAENITKDRTVCPVNGMSVEQQLSKLDQTKFREGMVCLFYKCVDAHNPNVVCRLETIHIKLR